MAELRTRLSNASWMNCGGWLGSGVDADAKSGQAMTAGPRVLQRLRLDPTEFAHLVGNFRIRFSTANDVGRKGANHLLDSALAGRTDQCERLLMTLGEMRENIATNWMMWSDNEAAPAASHKQRYLGAGPGPRIPLQ